MDIDDISQEVPVGHNRLMECLVKLAVGNSISSAEVLRKVTAVQHRAENGFVLEESLDQEFKDLQEMIEQDVEQVTASVISKYWTEPGQNFKCLGDLFEYLIIHSHACSHLVAHALYLLIEVKHKLNNPLEDSEEEVEREFNAIDKAIRARAEKAKVDTLASLYMEED